MTMQVRQLEKRLEEAAAAQKEAQKVGCCLCVNVSVLLALQI